MATALSPIAAKPLADAYGEFDATLRVRQAKLCCVFALTLVPLCIGLDYLTYPALVWPMFRARLLCDAALLPCFLAVYTPFGRRHVKLLGNAPCLLPGLAICWMIYLSEGVMSPYYAGLNIVMAGVILLIPYTLGEGIVICALLVVCYTIACVLHWLRPPAGAARYTFTDLNVRTLVNNLYFLGMTAVLSLGACHYGATRRFTEFRLRWELDANNCELASTVKKLQETEVQLVQSEKMNALGKLSAGLLHEINNPLNFTFMALQIADQEAGDNAGLKETLGDITQGMTRIKNVVSDLRAFAYPSKVTDQEVFCLDEALRTAMRLTAQELADIPVDHSAVAPCRVVAGKTQIMHVFMNMLVNAAHALRGKPAGRPPQITVSAVPEGDRLKVSVRDNGTGVAPDHLPRLLDPFFTTKQPGEGTGLGLSISHTIVKNHGGVIHVTSEFGHWTQFTFDLPLAPAGSLAA